MRHKLIKLSQVIALLVVVMLIGYAIKHIFFLFVDKTNFTDRVASFIAMSVLTAIILLTAKKQGIMLSIFPKRFTAIYITATILFAVFIVITPFVTNSTSFVAVFLLIYSAIATPIFEELLFRGYVYGRLESIFVGTVAPYIITALLFSLWHFGYVDSIALRVHENLLLAMLCKAAIGLFFGLVIGFVRIKTKNCYSSILIHDIITASGYYRLKSPIFSPCIQHGNRK